MRDAPNAPGFSFYTRTCGSLRSGGMRVVKQLLVFVLAIFTTLTCSWASLGDNYEKLEDSYGSIGERRLRDDGTVSIPYHKARYLYLVIFGDGHSISETYFHTNGTDLAKKELFRFQKADDLDEHVTGRVHRGKAIPVPVGNIGRDRGKDSGNEHETDPPGKARNARLRRKEHDQNCFEQFCAEYSQTARSRIEYCALV